MKVTRFCPSCKAKVKGETSQFEKERKCPSCGHTVAFKDIVSDPAPIAVRVNPEVDKLYIHFAIYGACILGVSVLVLPFVAGSRIGWLVGMAGLIAGILPSIGLMLAYHSMLDAKAIARAAEDEADKNFNAAKELSLRLEALKSEFNFTLFEEVNKAKNSYEQELEKAKAKYNFETQLAIDDANKSKRYYAQETEKAKAEFNVRLDSARLQFSKMEDERSLRRMIKLAETTFEEKADYIKQKLTVNNLSTSKEKLTKLIEKFAQNGFKVDQSDIAARQLELDRHYEMLVRKKYEQDRQREIQQQIREENKARIEREMAIKEAERREREIKQALDIAMKQAASEHSAEVERLKQQLQEAQAASERTKSMAELTRAGYIYVISNRGSFGANVFKVGMTRRLDPMDRVNELGDASVPFPFDVHAMISCKDAPTLERQLHVALDRHRINKVNLRKEFFSVDIETIVQFVKDHHGEIDYVADMEALEYEESQNMDYQESELIHKIHEDMSRGDDSDWDT